MEHSPKGNEEREASVLPNKNGTEGGELPMEDAEETEEDDEGHADCWFSGE